MRVIGMLFKVAMCAGAALAYLHSALLPAKPAHRIVICADLPLELVPPFQTGVVDEAGDRGLWIPLGSGKGWLGQAGGSATYKFYVPADDRYTLWGNCLWRDACTNAAFVDVDGTANGVLGNDPVYGEWHWVRGMELHLARGTHTLKLRNHSDGISLQRLAWYSDPRERPDGSHEAYYDIFYDGFDGCDGGNIVEWTKSDRYWSLREIHPGEFLHRVLEGNAGENGDAYWLAVVGKETWKDYALNVSVQPVHPGTLGVCFDWRGPDDYDAVVWEPTAAGPSRVDVVKIRGPDRKLVGSLNAVLTLQRKQDVQVSVDSDSLTIHVDGAAVGHVPWSGGTYGKAGLLVAHGGRAWFDDVHIRCAARSQAATRRLEASGG